MSFLLPWTTLPELALGGSSNYIKIPLCSLSGGNLSFEQICPQFLFWTYFLDNSNVLQSLSWYVKIN
jgi:hypothetical protein